MKSSRMKIGHDSNRSREGTKRETICENGNSETYVADWEGGRGNSVWRPGTPPQLGPWRREGVLITRIYSIQDIHKV